MSTEERDRARAAERAAYLHYLDRRMPELHAAGKVHDHGGGTVAEQVAHIRANMEGATYPGVAALWQANREWGAMSTEQRAEHGGLQGAGAE